MAIGKSHRIVIELEPALKAQIYASLKGRGLNLKEWFVNQAEKDLLAETPAKKKKKASRS